MNQRIECNPAVMMGKPVIRGTRVTVEVIQRKLGAGERVEDVLGAYPHLTQEDILAAQVFAAVPVREGSVV